MVPTAQRPSIRLRDAAHDVNSLLVGDVHKVALVEITAILEWPRPRCAVPSKDSVSRVVDDVCVKTLFWQWV